jgi:hypothetical protein
MEVKLTRQAALVYQFKVHVKRVIGRQKTKGKGEEKERQ